MPAADELDTEHQLGLAHAFELDRLAQRVGQHLAQALQRLGLGLEAAGQLQPGRRIGERLPLRLRQRPDPPRQGGQRLAFQRGIGQFGQRAPRDVDRCLGEFAHQRRTEVVLLALEFLLPALAAGPGLAARRFEQAAALVLGGFARLGELRLAIAIEGCDLVAVGARLGLRLRFALRRLRQPRGDALLALGHRVDHGAVQKALQQPGQDQEVEDLRGDGEPVDLHGQPAARTSTWSQKGFAYSRISATTKQ